MFAAIDDDVSQWTANGIADALNDVMKERRKGKGTEEAYQEMLEYPERLIKKTEYRPRHVEPEK